MSKHDPMCPMPPDARETHGMPCPQCDLIARVRYNEREQCLCHKSDVRPSDRTLTDLRAKVEGLDSWEPLGTRLVIRSEVLALIDKVLQ